jgi:hypothetical protein
MANGEWLVVSVWWYYGDFRWTWTSVVRFCVGWVGSEGYGWWVLAGLSGGLAVAFLCGAVVFAVCGHFVDYGRGVFVSTAD